jgi:hypothetical protein
MTTKQPAWSSNALVEANEKYPPTSYNNIEKVNKADTPPPRDKFFLAYGIFFIQGVSMLLPWNGKYHLYTYFLHIIAYVYVTNILLW